MRDEEQITYDVTPMSLLSGHSIVAGIVGGAVFGTAANIAALLLGHSFLYGLLCHSLLGLAGMVLTMSLVSVAQGRDN